MARQRAKIKNHNFKPGKVTEAGKIAIDRVKFRKAIKKHGIGEAAFIVLLCCDRIYQETQGMFTVTDIMTALDKKRAISETHLRALTDGGLLERLIQGNNYKRTQYGITKEGFSLIRRYGKLFFSAPVVPASPVLSDSGPLQTKTNTQADALTGLTFTPLDL